MSDTPKIREHQESTAAAAMAIVFFTLLSKGIGFLREMVIAGFFGTSYIVDAFVMAQSIPGMLLGGIFASLGSAYMPTFSEIVEKKGKEAGDRFTSEILNAATIFAIAVFALGALFARPLVSFIARDFSAETAELTVFYLRITFAYTIFSCGASILDAYLQYRGKYLKPIVGGYFQNIGVIVVAVISAYTSCRYLATGFLFGYLMRYLFILLAAKRNGFCYRPYFALNEPVKEIAVLAMPVFLGTCFSQLNAFVDKTLASGLQEGIIAALNYGMLLVQLITGLASAVVVAVIYPKITRARNNGDLDFFNRAAENGMTTLFLICLPFELGAMAFADEVVQVVYERGAFDPSATVLTGAAFFYYAIGLVFIALSDFLVYLYYSMRDMKTPVFCGAVGVIINIGLNLLLVGSMAHRGLALATSAAAAVTFFMRYFLLRRKHPEVRILYEKGKLVKITIAAILAVAAAVILHTGLVSWIWMPRLIYLMIAVFAAMLIYAGLLAAMKVEEIWILKEVFHKRAR